MGHEIRTPLNAIIGMTELLLNQDSGAERSRKLNAILYSSEKLLHIINDVLDLSKIESAEMTIESISFDFRTLVEEVMDVLAVKAYDKQLELILHFDESVPRNMFGDPIRIKQIIYNITTNAIKFTEKGHIGIHIDADQQESNEIQLTIRIEDTGIGIAKDRHEHIFGRTEQADILTTRIFGGTGLGLVICRRLARLMGGDVALESEPGIGSVFSVTLPMRVDTSDVAPNPTPTASFEGLRVLVVDDNSAVRIHVSTLLKTVGVSVQAVESASKAISALEEGVHKGQPFHIALIDFMMPDIDGIDFGKMVKKSQTIKDTLLVMLTAHPWKGLELELKRNGFSGFASKPLRVEVLLKLLLRAWDEHKKGGKSEIITQNLIDSEELHQMPERNTAEFHGIKTLLVEDNRINRTMAAEMLRDLGCDVATAEDGAAAVTEIREKSFDLVFMDCQMPNMDGYEATRIIKDRMENGDIGMCPVIALTANAMKGDREKCFAAGMNDYMTKPVRQEEIKQMLAKWLQ